MNDPIQALEDFLNREVGKGEVIFTVGYIPLGKLIQTIDDHVKGCSECQENRRQQLQTKANSHLN